MFFHHNSSNGVIRGRSRSPTQIIASRIYRITMSSTLFDRYRTLTKRHVFFLGSPADFFLRTSSAAYHFSSTKLSLDSNNSSNGEGDIGVSQAKEQPDPAGESCCKKDSEVDLKSHEEGQDEHDI